MRSVALLTAGRTGLGTPPAAAAAAAAAGAEAGGGAEGSGVRVDGLLSSASAVRPRCTRAIGSVPGTWRRVRKRFFNGKF